jgi:plastocyanin
MRPHSFLRLAVAAAFIVGASPLAHAQAGAKLTGRILFKGTAPDPIKIRMSADPRCMQASPNGAERKQIDGVNGGLANVIVSIKSKVPGTPAPNTTPVLLDQVGCMYTPGVVALQVGQPLTVRNSDQTLHNVHGKPVVNEGFNHGQVRKGAENVDIFKKPETIFPVSCDVHPWMRSYIAVFDHPYFTVTKEDGSFEIPNVPPGDYEIEAQHPTLKVMTGKVSVKAGTGGKTEITYTLK